MTAETPLETIAPGHATNSEPDVPPETPGARPYGIVGLLVSTVCILLLATTICILLGAIAVAIGTALYGWNDLLARFASLEPEGPGSGAAERLNVVVALVVYAAISVAILLLARFRGGRRWRDLVAWRGWHPFKRARLFWGLLMLTLVYSLGANAAIERLYPPSKDWITLPTGSPWLVLFVLLASVMAPITEELLFRGWLYTSLRSSFGFVVALLLSSSLFALAHWEKTHLYALAVFPVGLALGTIREKTGSIAASMTFHGLYNGFASALLVFVK